MHIFKIPSRLFAPEGDGSSGGSGSVLGNGAAGSGTPATIPDNWMSSLPDELRNDPSMKDYKPGKEGFASVVKTMISSQKMIGADKIVRPGKDSAPEIWDAFHDAAGRPKTAGDYALTVPEALKEVKLDEAKMGKWKEVFHKAGVSQKAFDTVLNEFLTSTHAEQQASSQKFAQESEAQLNALKAEWGNNTETNFNVASSVVAKFGGAEMQKYLTESGMGNDPKLIRLFASVGAAMMEDKSEGSGLGEFVTDKTRAQAEIKQLKGDTDFMSNLTNRQSVGHNAALERWTNLHKAFSK
jgi:hypothetical protein